MLSVAVTGRLVAATLAIIGLLGALGSYRLGLWLGPTPGPGLMPFVASVLLAVLAAIPAFARAPSEGAPEETVWPRLANYVGAAILLCFGPQLAGTTASVVAALLIVLIRAEGMSPVRGLVFALAIGLSTVALFRFALDVPLPDPVIDRLLGR